MIPGRLLSRRHFSSTARRITRELLVCIALPSLLLVSFNVVAQKADSSAADEQIAAAIHSKITANDALRSLNVGIWVHGGTATLSGNVPTPELRQQYVAAVQSVPGVTSVENQIAISQPPPPAGSSQPAPGTPPPPPTQAGQNGQAPYQPNGPPPPSYVYGVPGQPRTVTVPPGTVMNIMMLRTLDSRHTKVGKHFSGVVFRNVVLMNGAIAIPRGAYVEGTVIDSRGPGHLKGHPKLALQLDNLTIGDSTYPITTLVWARRGPGKGGQSTGNIAGAAATGAIIGGAVGGGPTALLGGLLGGLGGAGLSAASRGPQLFIPAESILTFTINAPVDVREPTLNEIRSLAGNVPITNSVYPGGGYPPPPPGPPGGYPY